MAKKKRASPPAANTEGQQQRQGQDYALHLTAGARKSTVTSRVRSSPAYH
jgi:hypothetical protein